MWNKLRLEILKLKTKIITNKIYLQIRTIFYEILNNLLPIFAQDLKKVTMFTNKLHHHYSHYCSQAMC